MKIIDDLRNLAAAGERFACLLADPPWAFLTYSGNKVPQRAKDQHYDTMTEAELSALPVADVVAGDAWMQMWVLDTHIDQALRIGAAWGFEYKTLGLIWQKMSPGGLGYIGLGHWFRSGGEVSILFTRGAPKRLVAGPRLELFARQQRPGWTVVGNEVEKFGGAA